MDIKVSKHTNIQCLHYQVTLFLLLYPHIQKLPYQIHELLRHSSLLIHIDLCPAYTHVLMSLAPHKSARTHSSLQMPTHKTSWPNISIGHYTNCLYVNMYTYSHVTWACSCKHIHIYSLHTHIQYMLIILALVEKLLVLVCGSSYIPAGMLSFGSAMSNVSQRKTIDSTYSWVSPSETWWFEVNVAIPYMWIFPILLKKLWFYYFIIHSAF